MSNGCHVTETDITRALDLWYPNERWEITLGAHLGRIRAEMREVLEGFAQSFAERAVEPVNDPEPDSNATLGLLNPMTAPRRVGY